MSSPDDSPPAVRYYGYNFTKANSGGFGAMLMQMLSAYHYTLKNGMTMAFVKEGLNIPRFNGAIDDVGPGVENKTFHSYFDSIPDIIPESKAEAVWPSCPGGFDTSAPKAVIKQTPPPPPADSQAEQLVWDSTNGWTTAGGAKEAKPVYKEVETKRILWYSTLFKKLYTLKPAVAEEVQRRVQASSFNKETDVVLHCRLSDKIIETASLPISVYYEETKAVINKFYGGRTDVRVFLSTEDKNVIEQFEKLFEKDGIEVVYDKSEHTKNLHILRYKNALEKSLALEDNMVSLKNWSIFSQALHLVGCRSSYFFRVGELLRYPNPAVNLQDSDTFGAAPYEEAGVKLVNISIKNRYADCVAQKYKKEPVADITASLAKNYIVSVPDFLNQKCCGDVRNGIKAFNEDWWQSAILPVNEKYERKHISCKNQDSEALKKHVDYAESSAARGNFAYHFKRTSGNHFNTCVCVACRLEKTFKSYEVMSTLSRIVGKKVVSINEMFMSKYEPGHFLTKHHDKSKGDYTFILSLTDNWEAAYGGITHFLDGTHIYKSAIPSFNMLTVFKLSPERQMDHLVSRVCGNKNRYSFTGWFSVEK